MTKPGLVIAHRLHSHSSESPPFFPGLAIPSLSYHSLQHMRLMFGTAVTAGRASASLQQALPSCCLSYLMSTPHLLLNDEMEALRLQGAT